MLSSSKTVFVPQKKRKKKKIIFSFFQSYLYGNSSKGQSKPCRPEDKPVEFTQALSSKRRWGRGRKSFRDEEGALPSRLWSDQTRCQTPATQENNTLLFYKELSIQPACNELKNKRSKTDQ